MSGCSTCAPYIDSSGGLAEAHLCEQCRYFYRYGRSDGIARRAELLGDFQAEVNRLRGERDDARTEVLRLVGIIAGLEKRHREFRAQVSEMLMQERKHD